MKGVTLSPHWWADGTETHHCFLPVDPPQPPTGQDRMRSKGLWDTEHRAEKAIEGLATALVFSFSFFRERTLREGVPHHKTEDLVQAEESAILTGWIKKTGPDERIWSCFFFLCSLCWLSVEIRIVFSSIQGPVNKKKRTHENPIFLLFSAKLCRRGAVSLSTHHATPPHQPPVHTTLWNLTWKCLCSWQPAVSVRHLSEPSSPLLWSG